MSNVNDAHETPPGPGNPVSLVGRTVVVTGGNGGLGQGVVKRFRALGARCLIADVRAVPPGEGPYAGDDGVSSRAVDLSDEGAVAAFYAEAASTPAGLWASIHLVGGFSMAPIADTSASELLRMFQLNAVTAFLCSREAIKAMRRTGGGRIVNVAARPALVPTGGMVAYSAAKAAVVSLTTSLADEVKRDQIWVNAIAPSIMDTPMNRASMPKADHSKWPSVDDVASAIAYLASPANALTTGLVMPVYGLA